MSAWICSKKHIDALTTPSRQMSTQEPNMIGQMLWEQNHRSVNYRYGENTPTPNYEFETCEPSLSVIDLLKLLDSYEYQSCEVEFDKRVADYCNRLRKHLVSKLIGYDDAVWYI